MNVQCAVFQSEFSLVQVNILLIQQKSILLQDPEYYIA